MSAGNLNLPSTCMPFLAVALALPSCAFAQAAPVLPAKQIRVIVALAPGGVRR
jgi:tripartite-type tricarboxylate transporter receptor subunit TctC